jgi:hypothetical protein
MSVKLQSALVPPTMTTAQRDAIPAGRRPSGSMIWNTTTSRLEINVGSDATPAWRGLPVADADVLSGANIAGSKLADASVDHAKFVRAFAYGWSTQNAFNNPSNFINSMQYVSGGAAYNVQVPYSGGMRPLVAGYYLFGCNVECTTAAPQIPMESYISGTKLVRDDGAWSGAGNTWFYYFNGSSDYFWTQWYQVSGSQQTYNTRAWMARIA